MIVANFYGGPGAGKSTLAAEFFSELRKLRKVNVELVTEFATDLCLDQAKNNLKDQIFLLGNQFHRIWRLEQLGVEVAVTDSPVMLGLGYARKFGAAYLKEFEALHVKLEQEFDNYNIFVTRDVNSEGWFKGNTKNKNRKYVEHIDGIMSRLPLHFHQWALYGETSGKDILHGFIVNKLPHIIK